MKKQFILLLLSISFGPILFGQSVEESLFKLDFIMPGVTYEHKITNASTAVINPMLGFVYGRGGDQVIYGINANINIEYRYYYNFKRRTKLNKNTLNNSANFIAPRVILAFPYIVSSSNMSSDFTSILAAVYGLQRTYNSGIYLLGEVGAGVGGSDLYFYPVLTFKVGYVFGRNTGSVSE